MTRTRLRAWGGRAAWILAAAGVVLAAEVVGRLALGYPLRGLSPHAGPAAVAITALAAGAAVLWRGRAARRRDAALDAYAAREMARSRRR